MSNKEYYATLKSNLVQDLFVRTADENYITARWCVFNHLHIDFFWLGVHALEKYMKAVLLLNGFSSIKDRNGEKYGHDIIRLYAQVESFAAELLPSLLEKPENLHIHDWVTLQSTNSCNDSTATAIQTTATLFMDSACALRICTCWIKWCSQCVAYSVHWTSEHSRGAFVPRRR
jgi:hypothetical protein